MNSEETYQSSPEYVAGRRWDDPFFDDMRAVWKDGEQIGVEFVDGTVARIDVTTVWPRGAQAGSGWCVTLSEEPFAFVVTAHGAERTVPGDVVRRAIDPEFAQFCRSTADTQY